MPVRLLSLLVCVGKALNATFLLLNFLAWVCCCVSFGGKLIHITFKHLGMSEAMHADYYWNYVQPSFTGAKVHFDNAEECPEVRGTVTAGEAHSEAEGGGR